MDDREELRDLLKRVRRKTLGTLDGWHEVIWDVEAFLSGGRPCIDRSAREWTTCLKNMLAERP